MQCVEVISRKVFSRRFKGFKRMHEDYFSIICVNLQNLRETIFLILLNKTLRFCDFARLIHS